MRPTNRIAALSEDEHTLHINPGKTLGTGQAEWMIRKTPDGWATRHALNGNWHDATGAEIVAAEAIVALLDHLKTEPHR